MNAANEEKLSISESNILHRKVVISLMKYKSGDIVGELLLQNKFSYKTPTGRVRSKWHCVCSCGKETDVIESNLSTTKSCGHLKEEFYKNRKYEDLTGQKFGYLIVKERTESRIGISGRKITRWLCQCICGKTIAVDARELKKGTVLSCGCKHFEKQRMKYDLTGKTINSIYVIEKLMPVKYNKTSSYGKYKCICLECGSEFNVFANALRRGQISCGCLNSKGEYEIGKLLKQYGISYKSSFSFPDLLSPLGYPVFFDFALWDNNGNMNLIEYQGIQHYIPQPDHFGDYQREITDPLKKEYCKNNYIHLYEITYKDDIKEKLNQILSEIYANFVPSSD